MVLATVPRANRLMYKIIGADGREYGPITADQLRDWIAEGRATAQTRAQAEGSGQWKPLTEYLEFAIVLARPFHPSRRRGRFTSTRRPGRIRWRSRPGDGHPLPEFLRLCCGCCYGLPFNVLGVIFALIALSQIKNDPQFQQGRGVAIAGLVLCLLSFVLAAITLVFGLALNTPDILRKMQRL